MGPFDRCRRDGGCPQEGCSIGPPLTGRCDERKQAGSLPRRGTALACGVSQAAWDRVAKANVPVVEQLSNPHWVDTNALPWICNPEAPEIALKIMRISSETGTVSLIVRQNGQAAPHYHLGAADFFVTSGRIGYRAGPPEGFGPGTYFWEPA